VITRRVFLTVGLIASLTASPGTAAEPIVVGPGLLRPSAAFVKAETWLEFVNRSGLPVHVEFFDRSGEQHHVIHEPDRIWAIFHRPGRHLFVVHFLDRKHADLHGAVDVGEGPHGGPDPLLCSWITPMGGCLER
jgi:hypothetical protein